MSGQYDIHWLQTIVKKILARNEEEINLATGKTPSGHIHLGILREIIICDALRRIFTKMGKKVNNRLFFDSLDAAKRFPPYIPSDFAEKYLGRPFSLIPPPGDEYPGDNYAEYFGNELLSTFKEFGIKLTPIWSHKLYTTDEMQERIRIGLKKADRVKEIILKFITSSMTDEQKEETYKSYENWMPAMVICEKCLRTQTRDKDGAIIPNRVISYDPETDTVTYKCPACGHEGKTKISDGRVKLNWRLDWPAKWSIFKTTAEPAGKDHCTVNGSYDTGLALSREIYGYEGPIPIPYEWVRLGDRDMKTSKGIVFTPKIYLTMVEPQIFRMLILRTNLDRHISFRIEDLPLLYEEYYRIEQIYYGLTEAENETVKKEIMYYYPLTRPEEDIPAECPPQIPFKFLIIMAQLRKLLDINTILKKANDIQEKKNIRSRVSKEYLEYRLELTANWLNYMKDMIAAEKDPKMRKKLQMRASFFNIPDRVTDEIKGRLNEVQKEALHKLGNWLKEIDSVNEENLKEVMMKIQQELKINARSLFKAVYLILLGAPKGPRLGPLMENLDIEWLRKRFGEI